MVKRTTLVKLSLLIIEFTSVPLLALASIYLLSGYQMLTPDIKAISEPRKVHIDRFLRLLIMVLMYLHSLGGLIFLIERGVKEDAWRKIMEAATIVGLTIVILVFLLFEITLR